MTSPLTITVEEMLQEKNKILIDLRSPGEYHKGTIDHAMNIPILDDEERAIVGTIYKNESREYAKITGMRHVSARLERMTSQISEFLKECPCVILFCSRGGYRSGPLVQLLNSLEIPVKQLVGGYKRYRQVIIDYFEAPIKVNHSFIVIHGYTGCGKTTLLKQLKAEGYPVIDLEGLARNSGSVFGFIGHSKEKMTQKQFDSLLFHQLIRFKEQRIIVESESRRIGDITIPREIHRQMVSGKHVLLHATLDLRVEQIMSDYWGVLEHDEADIEKALSDLVKFLGHEKIHQLQQKLSQKAYRDIARELMVSYYDPLYRHSIKKYAYDLEITYDTINEAHKMMKEYLRQMTDSFVDSIGDNAFNTEKVSS
ncbi:tRNA 2-selenouridine(34) synthase MnmH [Anoxynatronum sibiricum]|uniref:tRNA 2-selenouridine(34) synthase MnmH n=1 Tax=Anoxynatronum sibiricum TaxID=210623 RepID=A0ABU9VQF7_9CLOT